MNAASAKPVNWRELAAKASSEATAVLEHSAKLGSRLQELEGNDLLSAYAGIDGVLARACILHGSPAGRVVEPYLASLARARQTVDTVGAGKRAISYQLVSLALIAECAGLAGAPTIDTAVFGPLAAARRTFPDSRRRSMALTCLALGDTATALTFLEVRPATYDEPRLAFEFNLHELIRYLAAALDRRWPPDWVEPAWLEYLSLFPLHLAADASVWPDVFMFARVLAALRGDRIADIADDLHARVQRLAQETE